MPCVSIVENPHAHEFRCACAQFPSMVEESVGNFSRDSMGLSDSKKGEKIQGEIDEMDALLSQINGI